eukprot:3941933-Rhodomonas_salina.3
MQGRGRGGATLDISSPSMLPERTFEKSPEAPDGNRLSAMRKAGASSQSSGGSAGGFSAPTCRTAMHELSC